MVFIIICFHSCVRELRVHLFPLVSQNSELTLTVTSLFFETPGDLHQNSCTTGLLQGTATPTKNSFQILPRLLSF